MTTPQAQGEVPKYRVLRDSFYAPRLVKAGSIIQTHGEPGDHLEPLNDAARARMEDWYNTEHPTRDRDGQPDFTKMYKPHERFRITQNAPAEVHEMVLLAEPKPDDMTGSLSLAEVDQVGTRQNTDQRPGPLAQPQIVPTTEAALLQAQTLPEGMTTNLAKPSGPEPEQVAVVEKPAPDPKLANLKVK